MCIIAPNYLLIKPLNAKSFNRNGQIAEAERLYLKVLKVFPGNKKAKQGLAKIKTRLSSPTQDPPRETVAKLKSFYNKGQLENVVETAQAIVKEYPNTFFVWNIFGVSAARIGKLDKAIMAFKKAPLLSLTTTRAFTIWEMHLKSRQVRRCNSLILKSNRL